MDQIDKCTESESHSVQVLRAAHSKLQLTRDRAFTEMFWAMRDHVRNIEHYGTKMDDILKAIGRLQPVGPVMQESTEQVR